MITDISATITIEDAWELFNSNEALQTKFLEHVSLCKLDYDLSLSPYWALWFARFIIADEWLMGEDLMHKNVQVWAWYTAYTDNMRECGALGWSTKVQAKYKFNDRGQIIADLRTDAPSLPPITRRERSLNDVTDRISKQMEAFQKQRKRAKNNQQDID